MTNIESMTLNRPWRCQCGAIVKAFEPHGRPQGCDNPSPEIEPAPLTSGVCSTGYCQCAAKDAEIERLKAEIGTANVNVQLKTNRIKELYSLAGDDRLSLDCRIKDQRYRLAQLEPAYAEAKQRADAAESREKALREALKDVMAHIPDPSTVPQWMGNDWRQQARTVRRLVSAALSTPTPAVVKQSLTTEPAESTLTATVQRASERVAGWPEWKRNISVSGRGDSADPQPDSPAESDLTAAYMAGLERGKEQGSPAERECPECHTVNGHFGNCSKSDLYEPAEPRAREITGHVPTCPVRPDVPCRACQRATSALVAERQEAPNA